MPKTLTALQADWLPIDPHDGIARLIRAEVGEFHNPEKMLPTRRNQRADALTHREMVA
jgi:hypothetical protein